MKKENIVMVSIIIVIVAITAGVVGFKFVKNVQAPAEKVASVQPAPVAQKQENNVMEVKNGLLQNKVSNVDNKIALSLPLNWGDLVIPKFNASGSLVDSIYGTKDNQPILSSVGIDVENLGSISTRMISAYNYGERAEYYQAPTVVVYNYPAKFTDDNSKDPDMLRPRSAKQKEASFQPILDVFKKGNLDGMDLSQKCFIINNVTGNNDGCVQEARSGFWWDNFFAIYDRVGVRYFQNSTGDLRGIGYFDVSGQEIPDTIRGYKIILVNPEKRMLVYVYLPLENIYTFNRGDISIDAINKQAPAKIQKAYDYLENPENYKDQKLGQFLRETEAMVSSIKLVTQ
jgi:hypothetical protein